MAEEEIPPEEEVVEVETEPPHEPNKEERVRRRHVMRMMWS